MLDPFEVAIEIKAVKVFQTCVTIIYKLSFLQCLGEPANIQIMSILKRMCEIEQKDEMLYV